MTEGCELVGYPVGTVVTFQCSHLSNFALLLVRAKLQQLHQNLNLRHEIANKNLVDFFPSADSGWFTTEPEVAFADRACDSQKLIGKQIFPLN